MTPAPVSHAAALALALRALLDAGRFREVLARAATAPSPDRRVPEVALLIATAHTRVGEIAAARRHALGALAGFARRADDDGAMRAQNLLGAGAFEAGNLREATRRFAAAQSLARRVGDDLMSARTANNLASVHYLRGQVADARRLYREALLAYLKLGHRRGTAETYHNLGIIARDDGDFRAATTASEHAERHAGEAGEGSLLALVLTGRAESAVAMGEVRLADERLDRAARFAREASDEIGLAEIERVRAVRWWHTRNPSRALESAERSREVAARLGSSLLEAESAALSARALAALGRGKEALARRTEAQSRFETLGARLHLKRLDAAFPLA